jgi:hypothetical protein
VCLGLLLALCASGCGADESWTRLTGAVNDGVRGATCEAEAVPDLADFFRDTESGDAQLVHAGGQDLQVRSLLTGEFEPLFELQEPEGLITGRIALDQRDVFQVTNFGIQRFDRATRKLSLFAAEPTPDEHPALAEHPVWGPIAITETHVVSIVVDHRAIDRTTRLYPNYLVASIERTSGQRRFTLVEQPLASGELYAHGGRFFHVSHVDTDADPRRESYLGEVRAFDIEAGAPERLLDSREPFDPWGVRFWRNSLLATVRAEGAGHVNLVRVAISGGEPEVVATNVGDSFAVSGNEAFVLADDGSKFGRLTAIDLRNGEQRAMGTCDALPFHGSDDHVYAYGNGLSILRLTP